MISAILDLWLARFTSSWLSVFSTSRCTPLSCVRAALSQHARAMILPLSRLLKQLFFLEKNTIVTTDKPSHNLERTECFFPFPFHYPSPDPLANIQSSLWRRKFTRHTTMSRATRRRGRRRRSAGDQIGMEMEMDTSHPLVAPAGRAFPVKPAPKVLCQCHTTKYSEHIPLTSRAH